MQYNFEVENIRCGGCANTITKKLKRINGVDDVQVKVDEKQVIVKADPVIDANIRQILGKKLEKLGYPEVGTMGSKRLLSKATSVISCAIGKVSNKA